VPNCSDKGGCDADAPRCCRGLPARTELRQHRVGILADGTIQAYRQPQPKFEQIELLQKWMGGLDKNYKSRCLTSYEVILHQLERRGIDYANIKSATTVPAAAAPELGDTED